MLLPVDDGGPAFPRPASIDPTYGTLPDGDEVVDAQEGMSLRDYLAAKAMVELLRARCRQTLEETPAAISWRGLEVDTEGDGFTDARGIADQAYAMADAMLWARGKKGGA